MKQVLRFAAVLILCLTSFNSQAIGPSMGIFNHLGVGAHFGTAGYGFEVATPVTKFINLRAGMSFMPGISFGDTYDVELTTGNDTRYYDIDVDADIKRTQTHVIANIYPFAWTGGAFYIAAGAYFGGKDIVKLKGHSDELANLNGAVVEFEDYNIPVDRNGNVRASLQTKSVRPYLGLGFGRPVPTRRLNFAFELGVQFMGKMKIMADGKELQPVNEDADGTWHDIMDKVTVYPVMKFTLSGRIF